MRLGSWGGILDSLPVPLHVSYRLRGLRISAYLLVGRSAMSSLQSANWCSTFRAGVLHSWRDEVRETQACMFLQQRLTLTSSRVTCIIRICFWWILFQPIQQLRGRVSLSLSLNYYPKLLPYNCNAMLSSTVQQFTNHLLLLSMSWANHLR